MRCEVSDREKEMIESDREREMIESARERERERKKERGGKEGRWKERASEREGRATEALRGRHTHDTHERRGVAYIGCI